jgi:hypothetical protein
MFDDCQAKYMEYLAMERLMSGSQQGLETEANMLLEMISHVGEQDLYWTPTHDGSKPWLGLPESLPRASIHGQARIMRAATIWYQYTGDTRWKELVDRMVDGIDKHLVVHKDDYAYIPLEGWWGEIDQYHRSAYTVKGWKNTDEPMNEKDGLEGSLFCHQGHYPGVLANWYMLTGNKQALRLSGEMVRFLIKPQFWADWEKGEYPNVSGPDHAHWLGHFHGHINTLRAILEYAIATNDSRLKQFVRDGYEWARQAMLARIGFVGDGQGCGCGRLIGLAAKLSKEGIGDYWEDVDLYIRNHGTEMQFVPEDISFIKYNQWTHALIGGFGMNPAKIFYAGCCSPWGNLGIFYAWDGILEYSDGEAKVNLLLNRASPWLDIDSYLPYEGKVVIRNKQAQEIQVRIPLWVDIHSVKCQIDQKQVRPRNFGRYLQFENLDKGSIISIELPMIKRSEKYDGGVMTFGWPEFLGWSKDDKITLDFKGNTLIKITPSPHFRPQNPVTKWSSSDEPSLEIAIIFPKPEVNPSQALFGFGQCPLYSSQRAFYVDQDGELHAQWNGSTHSGINTNVKVVRDGKTPQFFRITRYPDFSADFLYKNGTHGDWQKLVEREKLPDFSIDFDIIAIQALGQPLILDYVKLTTAKKGILFEDQFDGSAGSSLDSTKWTIVSGTDNTASALLDGSGRLVYKPSAIPWTSFLQTPPYEIIPWWPYSQRAKKYTKEKAPIKKVTRYVTEQRLIW